MLTVEALKERSEQSCPQYCSLFAAEAAGEQHVAGKKKFSLLDKTLMPVDFPLFGCGKDDPTAEGIFKDRESHMVTIN